MGMGVVLVVLVMGVRVVVLLSMGVSMGVGGTLWYTGVGCVRIRSAR